MYSLQVRFLVDPNVPERIEDGGRKRKRIPMLSPQRKLELDKQPLPPGMIAPPSQTIECEYAQTSLHLNFKSLDLGLAFQQHLTVVIYSSNVISTFPCQADHMYI